MAARIDYDKEDMFQATFGKQPMTLRERKRAEKETRRQAKLADRLAKQQAKQEAKEAKRRRKLERNTASTARSDPALMLRKRCHPLIQAAASIRWRARLNQRDP